MPIELTCSCGKRLQALDEFAGQTCECPVCGARLQIPQRDAIATDAASLSDEAIRDLLAAVGFPSPQRSEATNYAVAPHANSATSVQVMQMEHAEEDGNAKLTGIGCALTLLSVAVVFGVALPMVRWRDPETGQPLPRSVAIFSPLLLGAAFHGIGLLVLKLVGLRVWSKREQEEGKEEIKV
jgi:hypothetical protein